MRRPLLALALLAPLGSALVLPAAPARAAVTPAAGQNEVLYTLDQGDGSQVLLRQLATGTTSVVLGSDASDYSSPTFTPDAQRVVASFDTPSSTSDSDTVGLVVVGRTGTGLRTLTSTTVMGDTLVFDHDPSVSPDGTTVLFTRSTLTATGSSTGSNALWTVPIAGGTATKLLDGAEDGAYDPSVADGSRIVYDVNNDATGAQDTGEIFVSSSGSASDTGKVGTEAVFSPDGTRLAYVGRTDTTHEGTSADKTLIFTDVLATGAATALSASASPGHFAENPSWLPDGLSLVYDNAVGEGEGYAQLYGATPDGRQLRAILPLPAHSGTYAVEPFVAGPAPTSVTEAAGSLFTSVTPTRVLDTRKSAPVGPLGTVTVPVGGRTIGGTAVPADATAVVATVTVVDGTTPTIVRAYPSGTAVPSTSLINTSRPKQVVPNQVTVQLGSDGAFVLRNNAGKADLLVDVTGYYSSSGQYFHPLTPTRLLDSRNGTGTTKTPFTTAPRDLAIAAQDVSGVTVPADATAVVLNLTGTGSSTTTFVRAYPTPSSAAPLPVVSSLNLVRGETAGDLVTVPLGSGGRIRLQNAAGTVDLVADIAGYYGPTAAQGTQSDLFVPVTPTRFLDTRAGTGAAPVPVGASAYDEVQIGGTRGVPADAAAAVLNLTATGATTSTSVRGYPSTASSVPTVSNLNPLKGDTRANAAIIQLGTTGALRLRNGAGDVSLLADLAGYFEPVSVQ